MAPARVAPATGAMDMRQRETGDSQRDKHGSKTAFDDVNRKTKYYEH